MTGRRRKASPAKELGRQVARCIDKNCSLCTWRGGDGGNDGGGGGAAGVPTSASGARGGYGFPQMMQVPRRRLIRFPVSGAFVPPVIARLAVKIVAFFAVRTALCTQNMSSQAQHSLDPPFIAVIAQCGVHSMLNNRIFRERCHSDCTKSRRRHRRKQNTIVTPARRAHKSRPSIPREFHFRSKQGSPVQY